MIHQNGIVEESRQMIDKKPSFVAFVAKNGDNAQFQFALLIQEYFWIVHAFETMKFIARSREGTNSFSCARWINYVEPRVALIHFFNRVVEYSLGGAWSLVTSTTLRRRLGLWDSRTRPRESRAPSRIGPQLPLGGTLSFQFFFQGLDCPAAPEGMAYNFPAGVQPR